MNTELKWKGDLDSTAVAFYHGKGSSQVQAARYLGGKNMLASTGELVKLTHPGINTISSQTLWIYPEIEEINKTPLFSILSRVKFWFRGISLVTNSHDSNHVTPLYPVDEPGSVFAYTIDNNKCSLGQATDIQEHQKRYNSLIKNQPNRKNKICYGVSRGAAATFAAIANNQYQDIKLCVLEGPPGSIRSLVKAKAPFGLGKFLYNTFLSKWLFGNQHETAKEAQAQAYVDQFPLDIPLVVISSTIDSTVPHDNSLKLAQLVAQRRLEATNNGTTCAPVYFIQLDKSDHDEYYRTDKSTDALRYQNILHAIYKLHNLPYIPQFAELGEKEVEDTILTKGFLAQQVKFQGDFKSHKKEREAIKTTAMDHLVKTEATERQKSICANFKMYRKNKNSFFPQESNEEKTNLLLDDKAKSGKIKFL